MWKLIKGLNLPLRRNSKNTRFVPLFSFPLFPPSLRLPCIFCLARRTVYSVSPAPMSPVSLSACSLSLSFLRLFLIAFVSPIHVFCLFLLFWPFLSEPLVELETSALPHLLPMLQLFALPSLLFLAATAPLCDSSALSLFVFSSTSLELFLGCSCLLSLFLCLLSASIMSYPYFACFLGFT